MLQTPLLLHYISNNSYLQPGPNQVYPGAEDRNRKHNNAITCLYQATYIALQFLLLFCYDCIHLQNVVLFIVLALYFPAVLPSPFDHSCCPFLTFPTSILSLLPLKYVSL